MVIGLERGMVKLTEHDIEWKNIANATIEQLWRIFDDVAKDIQHIGSTAIKNIKAKPIIDIAVAVDDFVKIEKLMPTLESEGFSLRKWSNNERMLFAIGDYSKSDGIVTHFIHIVKTNSEEWFKCVNFRDYLNANISVAKAYESLKIELAEKNPYDPGREKYIDGKNAFIGQTLADAEIWKKQQLPK